MPIISVKAQFFEAEARLNDIRLRQLPFATARALNDAAAAARDKMQTGVFPRTFDRPIKFTVNSIGIAPASKSSLAAVVFIKDKQAQYLLHEEIGGTRTASENVNKPAAALILPGKTLNLNSFGNIPYGTVQRLFAQVVAKDQSRERTKRQTARKRGTSFHAGYDADRSKRDMGYFYMQGKSPWGDGSPGGIFKRGPNHTLNRLLSFEASATYRPILHYADHVQQAATVTFSFAMAERLTEAISSQK